MSLGNNVAGYTDFSGSAHRQLGAASGLRTKGEWVDSPITGVADRSFDEAGAQVAPQP